MGSELISVIVPIYNVEDYLEKCLDSIINQTYKNLEIILIDDGSIDSCGTICDEYKELDNRIVVIHKQNGGLSSARNAGLDIAKGELISFVDSDDYLELNMLEELKKNMEKYNSDISICNFYYIYKEKRSIKNKNINLNEFVSCNKDKYDNIVNEYDSLTYYAWNKLYKNKIFNNIRFPNGRVYEYTYILCNILNNAERVSYTLKPLYNYVYRSNSIGNNFNINHFNKIDSHNKKIDFFCENGYYDLLQKEKNNKANSIIKCLSKMKQYGIKNKEIFNKYYQELADTNKEVKWKGATKYNKIYKVFRKPSISIIAFMMRIKDMIE